MNKGELINAVAVNGLTGKDAEEDDLKAREIPYEDPDAPENKEWDMMHKYF